MISWLAGKNNPDDALTKPHAGETVRLLEGMLMFGSLQVDVYEMCNHGKLKLEETWYICSNVVLGSVMQLEKDACDFAVGRQRQRRERKKRKMDNELPIWCQLWTFTVLVLLITC